MKKPTTDSEALLEVICRYCTAYFAASSGSSMIERLASHECAEGDLLYTSLNDVLHRWIRLDELEQRDQFGGRS